MQRLSLDLIFFFVIILQGCSAYRAQTTTVDLEQGVELDQIRRNLVRLEKEVEDEQIIDELGLSRFHQKFAEAGMRGGGRTVFLGNKITLRLSYPSGLTRLGDSIESSYWEKLKGAPIPISDQRLQGNGREIVKIELLQNNTVIEVWERLVE